MPNWCEGILKIRGKKKDLKKFFLEGIIPVNFRGEEKKPLKAVSDEEDYFELRSSGTCYIPHTTRGFIEDFEVYMEGTDDDIFTVVVDSKFAWEIMANNLLECCKEYKLDMKIYAFESNTQFNQDIEIVEGEIIKNDFIMFEDYVWECINPNMGG